ncbi:uncharacterized protein LOC131172776 [Hevea brasiliensis]|uniref:uncharacterized protein LOC131172776 n=1 Tax=Hevea brasiliensis TaxID=3981 RepID=UPI000B78DAF3|nr:uncharacterized protein LOC131172776 [Hevea brasiliensis]
MASTSSTPPNQWKPWDVFIGFRGDDTRYTILSHLRQAFEEKQIKVFKDEELRKGEEISSELLKIIRESTHGSEHLPLNSSNNFYIEIACIVVVASATYSASVVESVVHSCFFVAHAIAPLLCRKAYPVVLRLSSKH